MAKAKSTKKQKPQTKEVEVKEEKGYYKQVKFEPINSATQIKIFDLANVKTIEIDGVLQRIKEPKYSDLPESLIVYKGDIPLKLTENQYKELKKEGLIETEEERNKRFSEGEAKIPKQHGVDERLAPISVVQKLYENILIEIEEE